ncbi:xanthine dehydrogenase family protein subunit M [Aurantimonas sp. MSK8Z-1]|uniref:FAD binding domain-containing protein n=1 Tax=Mangrovibrevibacter kandeliae TaxID=2968473 RepID=UPI002118979F|nr:xanthine dehydrogenase family protein subunit M [Aurantimonas sp. MSK8Z-1]MCW4116717.1 xanthine dehydrogenase family protein subunit M [Aurantimonas sp. MSK8Z-1]
MHPFAYQRASSEQAAVEAGNPGPGVRRPPTEAAAQFVAGGTNMSDYMRLNVTRPDVLIDINELSPSAYGHIEADSAGLRIGGLVRMAEAEDHPVIRSDYPVIHDTLKLAATRQIRNMASLGGNVLQRTRCEYFREASFPCNKRQPGSGCSALDGFNRRHAVLGVSDACIATYPGDFAQALIALDARVEIMGPQRRRTIAFSELHRQPGDTPNVETGLAPGELITGYVVPAGPHTRRSRYVKTRDRESYQFALASAAIALDLDGATVKDVRIALGGVATVPWRAHEAEQLLVGQTLDETLARRAADAAFAQARTREHNGYKVPIGKETLVRALLETQAMDV